MRVAEQGETLGGHRVGGLLWQRNFRLLWVAQIVSEIGDWFYIIAIYSLLLQITGKAQSVGLALVLQVLPVQLVNMLSGADDVSSGHGLASGGVS